MTNYEAGERETRPPKHISPALEILRQVEITGPDGEIDLSAFNALCIQERPNFPDTDDLGPKL